MTNRRQIFDLKVQIFDQISIIYDEHRISSEEAIDLLLSVAELERIAQNRQIDGLNGQEEAQALKSIEQEGGFEVL